MDPSPSICHLPSWSKARDKTSVSVHTRLFFKLPHSHLGLCTCSRPTPSYPKKPEAPPQTHTIFRPESGSQEPSGESGGPRDILGVAGKHYRQQGPGPSQSQTRPPRLERPASATCEGARREEEAGPWTGSAQAAARPPARDQEVLLLQETPQAQPQAQPSLLELTRKLMSTLQETGQLFKFKIKGNNEQVRFHGKEAGAKGRCGKRKSRVRWTPRSPRDAAHLL